MRPRIIAACVLGFGAGAACRDRNSSRPARAPAERAVDPAAASRSAAVLVGAGDIASCTSGGDEATATLLDRLPGTVAALGDNAYRKGTAAEYALCYGPTWGRHKARTRPTPGNHEYRTPGATGYYGYFGAAAGDPGEGYYSYELGTWHVVVLNSNIAMGTGSPQERWLRADVAAHPTRCTLAYWHHPRFSSGAEHGSSQAVRALWQALYHAGADVVLNGHEHLYERFAPQTPGGAADPRRGIRQFTVGTGGESHYPLSSRQPNSEAVNATVYGVLRLELGDTGYRWSFIGTDGVSRDAGTGTCH